MARIAWEALLGCWVRQALPPGGIWKSVRVLLSAGGCAKHWNTPILVNLLSCISLACYRYSIMLIFKLWMLVGSLIYYLPAGFCNSLIDEEAAAVVMPTGVPQCSCSADHLPCSHWLRIIRISPGEPGGAQWAFGGAPSGVWVIGAAQKMRIWETLPSELRAGHSPHKAIKTCPGGPVLLQLWQALSCQLPWRPQGHSEFSFWWGFLVHYRFIFEVFQQPEFCSFLLPSPGDERGEEGDGGNGVEKQRCKPHDSVCVQICTNTKAHWVHVSQELRARQLWPESTPTKHFLHAKQALFQSSHAFIYLFNK